MWTPTFKQKVICIKDLRSSNFPDAPKVREIVTIKTITPTRRGDYGDVRISPVALTFFEYPYLSQRFMRNGRWHVFLGWGMPHFRPLQDTSKEVEKLKKLLIPNDSICV